MMVAPPAFQVYPKDWDAYEDVKAMTDTEVGFHLRLVLHAWLNDGVPSDLDRLAMIMSRPTEYVKSIWPVVGRVWQPHPERPDRLTPIMPPLLRQREEMDARRDLRRAAAEKRWSTKSSASAPAKQPMEYIQEPNKRVLHMQCLASSTPTATSKKKFDAQPAWDKFLASYPSPTETDAACRAFVSLVEDEATAQAVLDGLARWKKSEQWAGGYIHSMKRWITDKLWLDSPKPSAEALEADRPRKKSRVGCDPYAEWIAPWKDEHGKILPEYNGGDPQEEAA